MTRSLLTKMPISVGLLFNEVASVVSVFSVLQCVAVCCSVLQCVAVCCSAQLSVCSACCSVALCCSASQWQQCIICVGLLFKNTPSYLDLGWLRLVGSSKL